MICPVNCFAPLTDIHKWLAIDLNRHNFGCGNSLTSLLVTSVDESISGVEKCSIHVFALWHMIGHIEINKNQ